MDDGFNFTINDLQILGNGQLSVFCPSGSSASLTILGTVSGDTSGVLYVPSNTNISLINADPGLQVSLYVYSAGNIFIPSNILVEAPVYFTSFGTVNNAVDITLQSSQLTLGAPCTVTGSLVASNGTIVCFNLMCII